MKMENDYYLIFAIFLIFSLCLAILAFFCGADMVKNTGLKIVIFVFICIFFILFSIFLGFAIFDNKKENTKRWIVYSNPDNIPNDTEKLMFDKKLNGTKKTLELKNLRIVEIYVDDFDVETDFFAKCQNIEEVTFFQNPNNFNPETFSKNLSLEKINLVGDRKDWIGFQIVTPKHCRIEFIPMELNKISENEENTIKHTVNIKFITDTSNETGDARIKQRSRN